MTILFLSRLFYPHIGGVEKHVYEIGERLSEKGHRVIVISEETQESHSVSYQSNSPSATSVGRLKKLESYNIKPGKDGWQKKFRIWKQLWGYRKIIKSADVVHCHDVFFWYLPFRFIFLRKKVYTTFHGYEGNNLPGRKAILMHKLAEKLSYGNICVGAFLNKWYGTKTDFVTYGAVNLQAIEKYKTKKIDKKKSSNKIIFIGRLENETGIMKYLQAFKILNEQNKNFSLDVYGKGSLENEIKKYREANNLNINLKGFIMNIESVLNNYGYVFCSRYLGMLESMTFSKPVFAEYNNLIKKDYLQMTPFADYISIAENAKNIAKDFEDNLSGQKILDTKKAYAWVKNYTWDEMVNLYLQLWKAAP